MKLRTKLALAQLPLVLALGITIVVGTLVAQALGRGAETILKDNYRSVLAAQRMKEAAERIDSGIGFMIAGREAQGLAQIRENVDRFSAELTAQEQNITEPGERDATARLRAAWTDYQAAVPHATADQQTYFDVQLPKFLAVKDAADAVLAMNQDAMMAKSDRAEHLAGRSNTTLLLVSIAGLVIALIAAAVLTTRVLRPLNVLGQTARRLGEGDLVVRARVASKDEIGALAHELNTMAEHLQKYRESSLGDLLEAQLAAQATIDSLPDPVIVVALDGGLRHANRAAEDVLKIDADGGTLTSADPAIRAIATQLRQHVAAGKGAYVPRGLDESLRVGDRLFLPRAAPLYAEEGDIVGVTVVFQDVTRLQRFEELRNDLVATVAHELRTPLTSLRMAVHLLAEETVGPLTTKQSDLVHAAREESERLQAIVDELLDLSRLSADKIELRTAPADPEELVREALAAQHSSAEQARVTLRAEVLPNMPRVVVDRERIALVFANLVSNAIHYSPAGSEVTVRATAEGTRVRFEVADRGKGIPAELRDAVFDKYMRVPGSPAGGAGLGLFIARENVRAHGGEIGVGDHDGPGTTIWFTVPTGGEA